MKLEDAKERKKLLPAMKEVNMLVLKYKGSLSGEHNDGLVRGPGLSSNLALVYDLMRQVKHIMDPRTSLTHTRKLTPPGTIATSTSGTTSRQPAK